MNKICRICLEEGVLTSIYAKNFNLSLCDMIEYCSAVKISKNDGFPEQLCSNCIYKLRIAYQFKQTCENADIRLRQCLGLQIPNKYNDVSVMTDPIITHQKIKRCKCKVDSRKSSSKYKKKPESEKLRRGPKPKPKQEHACYHCNKQFRCQAQLEMHIRTHTGDKPFACVYCPRKFTQKHNLTIHLRVHTGEKPFQCEVCSKRFSTQGNLHAHLKIHTGQRDHKLHKMKKRQILPQSSKLENEAFNNDSNMGTIRIDVGKEVSMSIKNQGVSKLVSKNSQNIDSPSLMTYEQKGIKDMYYSTRTINENHNCTVCGEEFPFLTALAQHYLHQHKGCDTS